MEVRLRHHSRKFLVAAMLMAFAASFAVGNCARAADRNRHVVIISIDGFAAYLLGDTKAPIPTIRQLAREGATVVEGLRVSNPSVTWPNHTSLVTGVRPEKHGVLANGVLVRGAVGMPVVVDPFKDKRDLVRVATLFDIAHAAGLTTADVNWPCTRGSESLDDSFPDTPDAVKYCTPRLRDEMVAAGILVDSTDATFKTGSVVGRDLQWTEAACHLIRQRKPNLLYLHLLNVDATHHSLGPQSPAGYTANAFADACVARVLRAIDDAGIRDQTTVFVVADHGFTMTPKAIRPNVVLRQEGLLTVGAMGKVVEARVNVVPEGGIGLIYCNDPSQLDADRKRVAELLRGREGVAGVLEPSEFAAHGMPHPREYSQAPDLIVVAKDGYGVSGGAEGDAFVTTSTEGRISLGSHGFLSDSAKMNAVCVVAGRGIRKGAQVEKAENIDIAPTAAVLLGVEGLQADGRALRAMLSGN